MATRDGHVSVRDAATASIAALALLCLSAAFHLGASGSYPPSTVVVVVFPAQPSLTGQLHTGSRHPRCRSVADGPSADTPRPPTLTSLGLVGSCRHIGHVGIAQTTFLVKTSRGLRFSSPAHMDQDSGTDFAQMRHRQTEWAVSKSSQRHCPPSSPTIELVDMSHEPNIPTILGPHDAGITGWH